MKYSSRRFVAHALCVFLLAGAASVVHAKDAPPQVSPEGLELQQTKHKNRLVYLRPGADFSKFQRVGLIDCYVEFEKDWQEDYNRSRIGLEGKVKDEDVERMKAGLAAEFKRVFAEELQKNGGYEVVNAAAPDVLVLRPALINVEVSAPDIMTAGISRTVVRSAGQMTLYLELWDGGTNTLLARIMDAEADPDSFAQVASGVSNKAAADRILGAWARELRERLDSVRKPATP
jgi:hypothetical protein